MGKASKHMDEGNGHGQGRGQERRDEDGGGEARRAQPKPSSEQSSPDPERRETVQEQAGEATHQQEDPPQAEGPRKDVE